MTIQIHQIGYALHTFAETFIMKKNLLQLLLLLIFAFKVQSQCSTFPKFNRSGFITKNGENKICLKKNQYADVEIQFQYNEVPMQPMSLLIDSIEIGNGLVVLSDNYNDTMEYGDVACFRIVGTPISSGLFFPKIKNFTLLTNPPLLNIQGFFLLTGVSCQEFDSLKCALYIDVMDSDICVSASGVAFWDVNNNCVFDSNDEGVEGVKIECSNGETYFTNNSGVYNFSIYSRDSFTVSLDNSLTTSCVNSSSITFFADTLHPYISNLNFPIKPDTNLRDLSVTFNPFGLWLFGFIGQGNIVYRNSAFVSTDATLRMKYDSITQVAFNTLTQLPLMSVQPSFLDTVNRIIEWQIANIPARTQGRIDIAFQLPFPTAPSIPLQDTLWIFPDSTDAFPQDNIHIADNLIVGAYDPNDKQVSPSGKDVDGKITLADSLLTYKVRFQNTGTGPAVNVIIKDTLDSDLNLASLRPLMASHPYSTSLAGNVITFTFSNIMLPDSNANEPESHGFVQYNIKRKSGLGYGTVVDNSASIYFDFNEPIKTNTVTSTYFNFVSSVQDLETVSTVFLYPNPASQKVNVVASEQINVLVITDISGATLKKFLPAAVSLEIDLSELPAGIYFIAAKTAKGIRQNRLIKY